ncbi:hypothetical protein AGMMS49940_20590 [Spirochaetia bacterium]|nr:hypothetical protein AGMMS49940_20590 [Spirochaetia bacterium]
MEIKFDTDDFSPQERVIVCKKLGVEDAQLNDTLFNIANTAFHEYKTMILEHGIPATISALREERLHHLILHYFKSIPHESEIRPLFQLSASTCRTLLRNTITKNEMLFEDILNAKIQSILGKPGGNAKNGFSLEIQSELIVQMFNNKITEKEPGLQKIQLLGGTAATYECAEDTMELLKKEYLHE